MLIFELIDCDGPNFLEVRKQVFDFLLANEHKCVSLVSHFLKKDTRILYILDERNSIWGVLSISHGGQILHCLESEAVLPAIQEYFSLERPKKLFSIIGEQKYTDAIAKIMMQLFKTLPKASNEYLLMEYNSASDQVPIDEKKRAFLGECEIFCCRDSDFDDLFPIQKAYEFEEVNKSDKNQQNEQPYKLWKSENFWIEFFNFEFEKNNEEQENDKEDSDYIQNEDEIKIKENDIDWEKKICLIKSIIRVINIMSKLNIEKNFIVNIIEKIILPVFINDFYYINIIMNLALSANNIN